MDQPIFWGIALESSSTSWRSRVPISLQRLKKVKHHPPLLVSDQRMGDGWLLQCISRVNQRVWWDDFDLAVFTILNPLCPLYQSGFLASDGEGKMVLCDAIDIFSYYHAYVFHYEHLEWHIVENSIKMVHSHSFVKFAWAQRDGSRIGGGYVEYSPKTSSGPSKTPIGSFSMAIAKSKKYL